MLYFAFFCSIHFVVIDRVFITRGGLNLLLLIGAIGWAMNVQAQQQEMMAPPTGQRMMG